VNAYVHDTPTHIKQNHAKTPTHRARCMRKSSIRQNHRITIR
jgi:hypothetical protein